MGNGEIDRESLERLFEELGELHRLIRAGMSTLAVLERGAESQEMADALGVLASYLQSFVGDVGTLALAGGRLVRQGCPAEN
ncbi:hypothetical protein [Acutalibacter caecimuris]|uniref:hypothetical protein n=1 Tax=Acutalibacter caecimuris TaxID=3093657 RepID=UPI002AC8D024|nr:hypothetical protein [Acutalibacter sp. M00118]